MDVAAHLSSCASRQSQKTPPEIIRSPAPARPGMSGRKLHRNDRVMSCDTTADIQGPAHCRPGRAGEALLSQFPAAFIACHGINVITSLCQRVWRLPNSRWRLTGLKQHTRQFRTMWNHEATVGDMRIWRAEEKSSRSGMQRSVESSSHQMRASWQR